MKDMLDYIMDVKVPSQATFREQEVRQEALTRERYQEIIQLDEHFRNGTYTYVCKECGREWVPVSILEWKCPVCGDDSGPDFSDSYLRSRITTTSKLHIPKMHIKAQGTVEPEYVFLYSNTDNAHEKGTTRDWVVVYAYFPEENHEVKHTYTVVWTRDNKRVIAGIDMPEEE